MPQPIDRICINGLANPAGSVEQAHRVAHVVIAEVAAAD